MTRPRPRAARLATALALAAALLAAFAGCGRNRAGTLLVPTGIRPAPDSPTGSITGLVFFGGGSVVPDFVAPPFPPATVTLYRDTTIVRVDTLSQAGRRFDLRGVPPGVYGLVFRSPVFARDSIGRVTVRDDERDAGNALLVLDQTRLGPQVDLAGNIPGFTVNDIGQGNSYLSERPRGVWMYPPPPDEQIFPPQAVPAGTWRFKLVTDQTSTAANLIGYGGAASDTLVAPFLGARVRRGGGAATDLVVRFPATGVYQFVLDERMQTLDITPAPAPARPARRSRP